MSGKAFVLVLLLTVAWADIYMHNPRGSNNRLNEKSANRKNGNRAFDSQNNNRGGYNVGDLDETNGFTDNSQYEASLREMYDPSQTLPRKQYNMVFLEDSTEMISWTAQHGCDNAKLNCNFMLQYTCETDETFQQSDNSGLRVELHNGGNTGQPQQPSSRSNIFSTYNNNNNARRFRAESEEYYFAAKRTTRNYGLFTADQKLKGKTQIYTRQNPGGTRRGLEVPEERDHWPWWEPSIWRDIAWLGNDVDQCKKLRADSQNVKMKWYCVCTACKGTNTMPSKYQDIVTATTQAACQTAGGTWTGTRWNLPAPICDRANFSQVNNLGNVDRTANGGLPRQFKWQIPTFSALTGGSNKCKKVSSTWNGRTYEMVKIQMRIRYNISTMDYDPYLTNSSFNQNKKQGIVSPVQNNPTVDVGAFTQGLKLALNTAQTGRTFQDRSHVIMVAKRMTSSAVRNKKILNLNVQGKRGNIVQTYPAVEYDFWPKDVAMKVGECLHFQWTGSNTHNNGNPAGDGQAGDAGEGRGGSDRSNLVQTVGLKHSYPLPIDKNIAGVESIWDNADCFWALSGVKIGTHTEGGKTVPDCPYVMASAGYYPDYASVKTKAVIDVLLNNISPSFRQGVVMCPKKKGTFTMMCTRNNNFTNRDQKLKIVVS